MSVAIPVAGKLDHRSHRDLSAAARLYCSSADLAHRLRLTTMLDRIEGARGCLFTFHRVASSADWAVLPNREFYLDVSFLERFLAHLTEKGWQVVTMAEALQRLQGSALTDRFVNFSIDDAYRDTSELALPVFRKYNTPVTVYVTTGIPDGDYTLWSAGLETIIQQRDEILVPFEDGDRPVSAKTAQEKQRLYRDLFRRWDASDPIRNYHRFCERNGCNTKRLRESHAISWDMLTALRSDPLVEIGAHTVSHARISELTPDEALAEMTDSRTRLETRLGIDVRHFAFPYGRRRDCGTRDFALARVAGFWSAVTTRKALLWRSHADRYSLPRITINGADKSLSQMEAHLTGFSSLASLLSGAT